MKEEEIRNRGVFNRYLELAKIDAERFFHDKGTLVRIKCPACGSSDCLDEFEKHGFTYVSCRTCATLYLNPRPSFNELKKFYTESPSARFWVEEFFKPMAESRREKIFKPRADYTAGKFPGMSKGVIGDIGSGFGLFLDELKKLWPLARSIAIEPSPEQAEICRRRGLEVECTTLEELKGFENSFDILTAFELFEHLFDPHDFLAHVRTLLRPGGYLMLTTLNGQGFDIQLLWEKSKSVHPPHHLNFLNPASLSILAERSGFKVIECVTPGKLDWDIVEGMIRSDGVRPGRLWELVAYHSSQECKDALQGWIAASGLSSHMRLVASRTV